MTSKTINAAYPRHIVSHIDDLPGITGKRHAIPHVNHVRPEYIEEEGQKMTYVVYYDGTDDEGNDFHEVGEITCTSIKQAYHVAHYDIWMLYGILEERADITTRVYYKLDTADGLRAAALSIVKGTTKNMVQREGGSLQERLYRECRRDTVEDHDALDMISVTTLALMENMPSEVEYTDMAYRAAYLELNKYLYASRARSLSVTAMRTVYLDDIDGEIIAVNDAISRIVRKGEFAPLPDISGYTDAVQAAQMEAINAIAATLTATQKAVLVYMAKGYSVRQIADAMNRGKSTINEHQMAIRRRANALYPDGLQSIMARVEYNDD